MLIHKLLPLVKGFVSVGDIRKFEDNLWVNGKHINYCLAGNEQSVFLNRSEVGPYTKGGRRGGNLFVDFLFNSLG